MMGEVVVLMGVLRGGNAGFDRDVGMGLVRVVVMGW